MNMNMSMSMNINIVISNDFREKIQTHENWELDLGRAYSKQDKSGNIIPNIQDLFILGFFSENKVLCYKVGRMGALNFYTSPALPDNQVWVYNDDVKTVHAYDEIELQIRPEEYITQLLVPSENENEE
jgi:hypothetical protein